MSLEADLRRHPRGPARWGWAQRMMAAIARARGVISADRGIEVKETPSGIAIGLTSDLDAVAGDLPDMPFHVEKLVGGLCRITGGTFRINGTTEFTVADATIAVGADAIIFIEVQIELTASGELLTPRPDTLLNYTTDFTVTGTPPFINVTGPFGFSSSYVIPKTTRSATMRIPIAAIESGALKLWWHGDTLMKLTFYHDHWLIG